MIDHSQPKPIRASASPIADWMERDHARLDALLTASKLPDGSYDRALYDEFRRGLLRHINIEEKILFLSVQKLTGKPLDVAAKLRLDHGALGALLVLDPAPNVQRAIAAVLSQHNPIEEGPNGVYEECVRVAGDRAGTLLDEILASPEVPLATRKQTSQLLEAAKRCLVRAGFSETLLD